MSTLHTQSYTEPQRASQLVHRFPANSTRMARPFGERIPHHVWLGFEVAPPIPNGFEEAVQPEALAVATCMCGAQNSYGPLDRAPGACSACGKPLRPSLATRLLGLRRPRGLTHAEIARRLFVHRGTYSLREDGKRLTVGAYLTQWLKESAKPKLKLSTYRSYEQLVRVHIVRELGKHTLVKLSPQHVQAFLNTKAEAGLSARTCQYILAVPRAALNRAVKWQLVARNVATLVDPPRGPAREVKPISPEAAGALLAAAHGHRLEHLFRFLLAAGVRPGEGPALRWEDVDLDACTVTITRTLQCQPGRHWDLVEPKSARSKRTLPLIGPAARPGLTGDAWGAEAACLRATVAERAGPHSGAGTR